MPSVMAIVSKAVFERMVPKTVKVGDLVGTDRYASTPAAFKQLSADDAIFLVTVRPPKETLWLVGVIAKPTKKGKAWVGAANKTAIRDVTSLIKKLKFASGRGIEAKKGALAMSLQTPRVLTDADVALLRGENASVAAYRDQVELVPAAKKAKAQAKAAAKDSKRFVFANHRRPFADLKKLPKPQLAQLTKLTKQNGAGTPAQALKGEEDWASMETVDVVDGSRPVYQLYVWPYGAAELFEHDTTNTVGKAIQHNFELEGDDDPELRKALAAAYATSNPDLGETIDFRLGEVRPPAPAEQKATLASATAAMDRLERVLGKSANRWRVFSELTKAKQTAVRDEVPNLVSPLSGDGGSKWVAYAQRFRSLGLPPYSSLARWAGLEAATSLELQAGAWPVWKWILAVGWGETEIEVAARAMVLASTPDKGQWLVSRRTG